MADDSSQPKRKGRKLPPIELEREENDSERVPKKIKKKKVTRDVESESGISGSRRKSNPQQSDDLGSPKLRTTRKKKKKAVGNSREALVSEPEALSDRTQPSARRKKKKRTSQSYRSGNASDDLGLAAELADLEEDIVSNEDEDMITTKWTTVPAMKSEPLDKVFVEKESRFKSKNKAKLGRKRAEEEVQRREAPITVENRDTMYYALQSHKIFRQFCVLIQGLFAGIALWHATSTWILSTSSLSDFLLYYQEMAMPVNSMYYFLYAIVTVGALDRYDIGSPTSRLFKRCCTFQSGAVSILIYFIGLIFTTSMTHLDDKISLYHTDDDAWGDDTDRQEKDIRIWRILNLMRALMAIIGWIILSLRPQTDRLSKTLYPREENIFGDSAVPPVEQMA